jgi:exopolysaccharide biosynthesis polyprenyl glycosylphosphotransferase
MESVNRSVLTRTPRITPSCPGVTKGNPEGSPAQVGVLEPVVAAGRHSSIRDGITDWSLGTYSRTAIAARVKRLADVAGAATGLVVSAPVMMLVALAIKLESRGPVLFTQTRVGKHGRPFRMYKFRTMCPDAEHRKADLANLNEMSGPVFKVTNDPRTTRLGRFLRKYSIDELPQLVNVLSGRMSLVGPRPALPSEVEAYQPWHRKRLLAKPGLTCLWQVNGRHHVDFDEWMRLDLEYIDKSSLGLDLKILAKTVPAVLKGTGV